jgi:multicomponent Na+:H+ antiporter subunit D
MGALAQESIRRILSFHIVSQIGYMVAGLALATGSPAARRLALTAAIFYVIHHILVKANLFLVAGIVRRAAGSEELRDLSGLARTHPWLAFLFLVPALSLAGVPPLSGFWAKLTIIQAGLGSERYLLVAAAVVAGLMTLLSMTKIWVQAFGGEPPDRPSPRPTGSGAILLAAPAAVLALLTLGIGIWPEPLLTLAAGAADHLLAPGAPP